MSIDDLKFLFKEQLYDIDFCYIIDNRQDYTVKIYRHTELLDSLFPFLSTCTPCGFDRETNFPIFVKD